VLDAHPGEVLTTARIASLVGGSRDTVRNALLALSEQGLVEKVGAGQYQARAGAQVGVQEAAVAAA
jgi:DNA-binding GntR family transcriptional regulator